VTGLLRRACIGLLAASVPVAARAAERTPARDFLEIRFDAADKWPVAQPEGVGLRGSVWFEHGTTRIDAEGAVFNAATGEVYAEGPVVLRDTAARMTIECEWIRYGFRTVSGIAKRARLTFFPKKRRGGQGRIEVGEVTTTVVEADEVRRNEDGSLSASDATITSCEFARPHWRLKARRIEAVPGEYLRARGLRLYMGKALVFGWPSYTFDLRTDRRPASFALRAASSALWGNHLRMSADWPIRSPDGALCALDRWGMSVGHRDTRGWEGGLRLSWGGTRAGGDVRGLVFMEDATDDETDAGRAATQIARLKTKIEGGSVFPLSPSLYLAGLRKDPIYGLTDTSALDPQDYRYAGEPRGCVSLSHRSTLAGGWELEARVQADTDRGVRQEYLESDVKTGLPSVSFVDIHRRSPGALLSLHTNARVNTFQTRTEYLPEGRWSAPAGSMPGGFLVSTTASAGWLRRSYDEAVITALAATSPVEPYDAFRAHTRVTVSRPFRWGPIRFSPYVGTDQAFYDRTRLSSDAVVRGCALYGGSISTRAFGRFDVGGRPYRHVVELRAEYEGVSRPSEDPVSLFGFDPTDDLMERGRARVVVDQRLQTKRGAGGSGASVDVAGLRTWMEFFDDADEASALNDGSTLGRFKATAFLKATSRFTVSGAFEWETEDWSAILGSTSLRLSRPAADLNRTHWRLSAYHVLNRPPGVEPSSSVGLHFHLAPPGRWQLNLAGRYELEYSAGLKQLSVGVVRDFHDWVLSITSWRDPAKDDWGVGFGIVPRGYAVNLPAKLP
jgi:hypothetical protein